MPPIAVPAHLRRFVVEQDYSQYNAIDQAVWRFVLLQNHARLVHSAHPVYARGLTATGISLDRIPNVLEMNEKLARIGWGAVCVDGFIEPRAFQEFQAANILPIAADIRRGEHLVYTPAPDIIHEAAGHAPILPEPVFASYVRRMGELGRRAFGLPGERRVYRAVHALSEIAEEPTTTSAALAAAQLELERAQAAAPPASEATRLSRLYWWTAEYGLVGDVKNYKLYGAGLLSSLWESHACHAPAVHKRALDESCLDVAYDVTRQQPVLFVTPDFESLHELLDRVERSLACNVGGQLALEHARASAELASAQFSSGAWVLGRLTDYDQRAATPAWLQFEDSVALAWERRLEPALAELGRFDRHFVLTGALADGSALSFEPERCPSARRRRFEFASGAIVEGRVERTARANDGRWLYCELSDAELDLPGRPRERLARFVLTPAGEFVSAEAGAIDPRYYPECASSGERVPKPRVLASDEQRLLTLFERAARAHDAGPRAMQEAFPEVEAALGREFPRDWLLRWNLLESLDKSGGDGELRARLRAELEALEIALGYRQPIATGLRYLAQRAA